MALFESKDISQRQKLQKQVESFLLETQYHVWERTQEKSVFIKIRSRVEIHTQRKRVWAYSLMKRHEGSQKQGRDTHRERSVVVPNGEKHNMSETRRSGPKI